MVALDSDTACRGAAKEKAGRYCAFSVRAIRPADNLNFLQINSQRLFLLAVFRNGHRVLRHLCRTNNYDGYFSTEKFFNSLDNSADPTGNRSAASAYLHRNQGFKSLQLRENRRWHLWLNTSIFGVSKPWKQLCRRRFRLRHLYCWLLLAEMERFELSIPF